jgi:proton glutamate symport protein
VRLHHQIFLAMVLAGLAGWFTQPDSHFLGIHFLSVYDFFGTLFINALKMVVVPLIMSAIISGLVNAGEGRDLGRLGLKTVVYYMATGLTAVLIGLVLVNIIQPGMIDGAPAGDRLNLSAETDTALASVEGRSAGEFSQMLLQMLPPNIISAAAEGQLLGLIVFSLLFGWFLRGVPGQSGETLRNLIDGIYQTMMRLTLLIIAFAPLGVFGLIAATVTETGLEAIKPLAWFTLTVVLALFVHAFIVLPVIIRLLAGRSPWRHARAMSPALMTAFSSASSAATLPLTLECVEKRAGVSNRTASFVLPLGATVNMDGTALYECVVALFLAQAYGIEVSVATQFFVVTIALLTSIGVASIPAASLVAITVILEAIGLPAEAIGLVLVVDRVLDMCRTSVNVWSDSVGAVVLGRSEGEEDILTRRVDGWGQDA